MEGLHELKLDTRAQMKIRAVVAPAASAGIRREKNDACNAAIDDVAVDVRRWAISIRPNATKTSDSKSFTT